jgi:chemotaxis protein MotA
MFGIIGIIIVLVGVFGGFVLGGGHIHLIWQPFEMMIIYGAALGALLIGNPMSTVKAVFRGSAQAIFGHTPGKKDYVELLQLLFRFFQIYRRDGPQAVEKHVENPKDSDLFKAYPSFLKNHHAVDYLCDTMKVVLSSDLSQYDLDELLDQDVKAVHEEEHAAVHALATISESMPGLGIVAAVLGVVHTMGLLTEGTDVIGHSVGAALIGTFMGVLSCYGFIGPVSSKMNANIVAHGKYLAVIKSALVALQRGNPPLVCMEYARRSIFPEDRPTFDEMDKASKEKKAA